LGKSDLENPIPYWYTVGVMAVAKKTPKPKASTPKKTTKTGKKSIKTANFKQKEATPLPKLLYCSFCRKSSDTMRRLIAGPNNIFICDECIEVCNAILLDESKKFWSTRLKNLMSGKTKRKIEDVKDTEKGDKK